MRLTNEPLSGPHTCAVIPGRGADSEKEGFIDTLNDMACIDPHIYISIQGLREMVKFMEWPTPEEHALIAGQLADALERLEVVESELERANEALDAVEILKAHKREVV